VGWGGRWERGRGDCVEEEEEVGWGQLRDRVSGDCANEGVVLVLDADGVES